MAVANALPITQNLLSIGQVLELLQDDFNELSPSKLRFLEEQGLVTPERTASGYRKFSQAHIDRIRLILTLQRDHYLPLKVISGLLQDLDEGKNPDIPGVAPKPAANILKPNTVLNREELIKQTSATAQLVAEAIATGLLPATDVFPRESVDLLSALVRLAKTGITPRHLRALRLAAERDAELLRQAALNRGRSGGELNVQEESLQLAECINTVRSGILRHQLMNFSK